MPELQKVSTDIRGFVQHGLDEIESMKALPAVKRNGIITEMAGFFSEEENQMASKVRQGRRLFTARQLAGESTFNEIANAFNINHMRMRRLIGLYERLSKVLPPEGLVTAPADIGGADPNRPLGMYHEIINEKSLPKSRDMVVWKKFWADVAERRSEIWAHSHRPRTKPAELVRRVVYLELGRRLRQIAKKEREEVFVEMVGMQMTDLGMKATTFKPVVVPADFRPKRGRPPKKAPKGGD